MNMTKRMISLFLVAGMLTAVGCQQMITPKGQGAGKSVQPGQAGPSPSDRDNFPGGCLVVTLDNKPTREATKEESEQIWAGGEISAAPMLLFSMEEDVLGPVKNVSLVIQPLKDGKVIEGDIYQYAGKQKLAPGQPVKLDTFMHVKDNKLDTGLKSLPPGTYRIGLQVFGQKHWDRQRIDVTVKK